MSTCPQCNAQHPFGACPLLESTAFDNREDPLLGEVFADIYRVEWRLSIGGMSRVYRGTHLPSGLPIAVKVLFPSETLVYRTLVSSFEREVDATRRLRHPHVVEVYDAGVTTRDERYLIMELLSGEDLADRLDKGTLGIEEAIELADQVLVALGYAHAQGVIHRDLKPGNIWLSGPASLGRMHAKLVDFGVARIVDAKDFSRMLVGTPAYMAPEQIHGKSDGRADLYALAMTLYEALCDQRPYFSYNLDTLFAQALEVIPPPPSTYRPDIPPPLDSWILKALEKDPDNRFANAEEMRASLLAYKEARALSSRHVSIRTRRSTIAPQHDKPESRWTSFVVAQGPAEDQRRLLQVLTDAKATIEQQDDVLIASFGRTVLFGDEARRAVSAALLGRSMHLATAVFTGRCPSNSLAELFAHMRSEFFSPGDVRLDRETYQLVRGLFELRPIESGVYSSIGEKSFGAGVRGILGTEPPLIGRESEFSQLTQAADRFLSSESNDSLLLLGDAGLGKSRLKIELRRSLSRQQRSFEYIEGRGDPSLKDRPYALITQALRLGSLSNPNNEKISAAILSYLEEVAQNSPLLLVLEDLQWSDDASLALLPQIAACQQIWLIGLARPETLPRLENIFRKRLELWPFSLQDSLAFTKALIGDHRDLAEYLFDSAQGNPLLIEETLQSLRDANVLVHDGDQWNISGPLQAPTSVGAEWFLQAYLDALPLQEKELLKKASPSGPRFYGKALEILGADPLALPALVRKGLIVERVPSEMSGTREFLFRHPLLREAAQRLLLPAEKVSVHRELARWLSGREAPEAVIVAKHLAAAEEEEAAATWYRRAVEEALSKRQTAAALQLLSQAISMAQKTPSFLFTLLLLREDIFSRTGQRDASVADLEALSRLAYDEDSHAQVLFRRGRACWAQGEYTEARTLLQEGVAQARLAQHDLRVCEHLLLLAEIEAAEGHSSLALTLTAEARALAEAKSQPLLVASALQISAQLYQRIGDLYRSKLFWEQALAAARRIHERSLEAKILSGLGGLLVTLGRAASAEENLQSSMALVVRLGLQETLAENKYFLAQIALQKSLNDDAKQLLEDARRISDTIQHRALSAACRISLAFLSLQNSLFEEAVDNAAEALELAPDPWPWAIARAVLSLSHLRRGNLTAANAHTTAATVEFLSAIQEASPGALDLPEEGLWALCETLQRASRTIEAAQCKEMAQTFFADRASRISDDATRYAFVNHPGHRKLFL
jgi:eukaryotic-like serine/threonine-protein kinase